MEVGPARFSTSPHAPFFRPWAVIHPLWALFHDRTRGRFLRSLHTGGTNTQLPTRLLTENSVCTLARGVKGRLNSKGCRHLTPGGEAWKLPGPTLNPRRPNGLVSTLTWACGAHRGRRLASRGAEAGAGQQRTARGAGSSRLAGSPHAPRAPGPAASPDTSHGRLHFGRGNGVQSGRTPAARTPPAAGSRGAPRPEARWGAERRGRGPGRVPATR